MSLHLFMSTTIYTLMYYVPLYLQLRGHSTSRTGFLMLPESVGGGLGSLAVGFVTRLSGRYGTCKTVLPFLTALSSAGFMTISINSPSIAPEIYLFLYGLGYGGLLTVLLVALLSAVPQKLQGPFNVSTLRFSIDWVDHRTLRCRGHLSQSPQQANPQLR